MTAALLGTLRSSDTAMRHDLKERSRKFMLWSPFAPEAVLHLLLGGVKHRCSTFAISSSTEFNEVQTNLKSVWRLDFYLQPASPAVAQSRTKHRAQYPSNRPDRSQLDTRHAKKQNLIHFQKYSVLCASHCNDILRPAS